MDQEPSQAITPIDATSTSELMGELTHTVSKLVAKHVELAKAEAIMQAKRQATMAVGFAVAGLLGYAGFLLLVWAAVLGLARAMPGWAAALVVGILVCAVGGLIGFLGYRRRVRQPLWRTRETLAEDGRWLRPRTT